MVRRLFAANWQVREEWFDWCEDLPPSELTAPRAGGQGTILITLFHVVHSEHAWVAWMNGEERPRRAPDAYPTLADVRRLSASLRPGVRAFVDAFTPDMDGTPFAEFTLGAALDHVIAHEIHHMGQLSIWARQLGRAPVASNVIRRQLG